MHRTGVHGGVPPRLVAVVLAVAFVFGTVVLLAEALDDEPDAVHGDPHAALAGSRATAV